MEPIGGQCSQLCKSNSFSTSGQKCERDLAFGIEDVRPWGAQQKFSAAFADVSILAFGGGPLASCARCWAWISLVDI